MLSTRRNPALEAKIAQMARTLCPLVRVTDGAHHHAFPLTILNFHLLTSQQCDDLAHHFHQRTPSDWTCLYPIRIEWRNDATLDEKRRRIGRFIGLRGCESPLVVRSEEDIEREARRARAREEDEVMKRKLRWYN
ncbi:hypothetical protein LOCC1_G000706 [Lachnellula occidentalis]|uniref:Uncharacterized protein n=1 Tax=Lachnellula occidentalis TaxID=215460 RepID=A0A8H8SBB1_9HELO|nr:hypothetical protein LOCC1_G000706 [Lachnellula occidentalis]